MVFSSAQEPARRQIELLLPRTQLFVAMLLLGDLARAKRSYKPLSRVMETSFAVTDRTELVRVEVANGEPAWDSRPSNVRQILGANKRTSSTCSTPQDMIRVLRTSDGSQPLPIQPWLPCEVNQVNDRLYFVTSSGMVVAMRESDRHHPITALADYVEPRDYRIFLKFDRARKRATTRNRCSAKRKVPMLVRSTRKMVTIFPLGICSLEPPDAT